MEKFNPTSFRSNFSPILQDVIYFDSACITIPLKSVIKKISYVMNTYPACARGNYYLSVQMQNELDKTREMIGKYMNVDTPSKEIIFTKNDTEALNTVILGFPWEDGDQLLTTNLEHNSSNLPTMHLKDKKKVEVIRINFSITN